MNQQNKTEKSRAVGRGSAQTMRVEKNGNDMQVRVITLKYSEGQQGFSEEALRSATFGWDVLAFRRRLRGRWRQSTAVGGSR